MQTKMKKEAFSILELAIVITVISLLIAAITVSSGIKHKMEINNIINDISTINQAVNTFYERYEGLPGDIYNATEIFGKDITENGNSNGSINDNIEEACNGSGSSESLLFWQHLALAGLINGNYDYCDDTKNKMTGPLKYSVYTASTIEINHQNILAITISKEGGGAILSTKEAYTIDQKYDNNSSDANPNLPNITGTIMHSDGSDVMKNSCINASFEFNLQNEKEQSCKTTFLLNNNK